MPACRRPVDPRNVDAPVHRAEPPVCAASTCLTEISPRCRSDTCSRDLGEATPRRRASLVVLNGSELLGERSPSKEVAMNTANFVILEKAFSLR